jgi:hypothetical protein
MSDPALAPHVLRYLARVDAHLPTLADDDARHAFLKAEGGKWLSRYTACTSTVIAGGKVDPDVDATDYVLTIAELGQRARALETKVAA